MSEEHIHNHEHSGLGPEGFCICPKCGYKKVHTPGIPCRDERCPNCGSALIREGSYHHNLIKERNEKDEKGRLS